MNSVDSTETKSVLFIALNSGLGHRIRMERLQSELQNRHIFTKFKLVDQSFQINDLKPLKQNQLIVIDCRDIEISFDTITTITTTIITIDNLNQSRWQLNLPYHLQNKLLYYDTLPHPKLDQNFDQIMNQILFDDQIFKQKTGNAKRLCFYAGPKGFLSDQTISNIDIAFKNSQQYTRIGGDQPELTRAEYLHLLSESRLFITYPGMSFYESLFLGATPILIETGSEVHDQLNRYLVDRIGCLYLTSETLVSKEKLNQLLVDDQMVSQTLDVDLSQLRRAKPGIEKLADIIEERLHDI